MERCPWRFTPSWWIAEKLECSKQAVAACCLSRLAWNNGIGPWCYLVGNGTAVINLGFEPNSHDIKWISILLFKKQLTFSCWNIYVHDLIHFFFNKKKYQFRWRRAFGAFTRMFQYFYSEQTVSRGRANNVTCRFCDATVSCCSSTQAYADIVGRNVLGQKKMNIKACVQERW